jgi:hypothetical protein
MLLLRPTSLRIFPETDLPSKMSVFSMMKTPLIPSAYPATPLDSGFPTWDNICLYPRKVE